MWAAIRRKRLSEFYTSIFALCLEGSRLDSAERLKEAIGCIRDVRDAWSVAAGDPEVLRNAEQGGGPAAKMILAAPRGSLGSGTLELDGIGRRSAGNGELFFEKLFLEKAGVITIAGEQLFVGTEFGNAAADQDGDAVGMAHG